MIWNIEKPENEMDKILSYSSESRERKELLKKIEEMKNKTEEIPLIINGKEVKTDEIFEVRAPHNHGIVLAKASLAGEEELKEAIESYLKAWEKWSDMDTYHHLTIFRKAADLLAGKYRIENIAAIMMNQSKTPFEAEIDLAELVDFWRFNAYYALSIYKQQPSQAEGGINRFDWRLLKDLFLLSLHLIFIQ